MESSPCQPLKGLAPYVGGKRLLSRTLVPLIEKTPHSTYVEPFVGMGGVFFRRRSRPKAEVVNDLSGDVASLFRVLQRHYVAFVDMIRWQITTRSEFERLVATYPETLTDLERAARFFYLQKTAFGGKVVSRNFGMSPSERGPFDVTRIIPELEAYHERLAGVTIERLPYRALIERYDRDYVLFYLDPPYVGTEHFYGADMFGREDFAELAEALSALKGRFIMTLNDCADARAIFKPFRIRSAKLTYGIQGGQQPARELIISNG
jgi:DNA adenine methylase